MPLAACAQGDSPGTGGAPSKRDLDGRALAEEVSRTAGAESFWGNKRWDLAFEFVIVRNGEESGRFAHEWHRGTDAYTVSGTTKEGKRWRVEFSNIFTKEGRVTIDGNRPHDTLRQKLIDMGYGRFINDTYWLMMPLKLLDSGVHHRREADTIIDGKSYNVLALSFGQVGLTPGDHYRLFIDPATKLVERWRYRLESGREGEFRWEEYQRFGPVMLARRRVAVDGSMEIRFENIVVDEVTPRGAAQP